jgi:MFS family permease
VNDAGTNPVEGPRLGTFAALRHPNYRLWFFGQLVSLLGSWMQTSAQSFLVFELTHSPAYLGWVGFAAGLPSCLLMLYGGVVADRVPRRSLLVCSQIALALQAALLAGLTFAHVVQPWHILVLAAWVGVANAFDAPARQSFILEMVDRETLTNAIALNSTIFNSALSIGPGVAGILYASLGPAWCFAINAVSFLAVIGALLAMRLPPRSAPPARPSTVQQLTEGLRFVARHRMIRVLIATLGMTGLLGLGIMTLVPVWAVDVLHGHARTNGVLYSARGVGSLCGALMIASLGRFRRGRLLIAGLLLLPLVMLLFASVRTLPFSLLTLMLVGWGYMLVLNTLNATVQTLVPDELRGRVMSIYMLTFFGLMPLGALFAGSLAARLHSAPLTVELNAGALLLFGVAVALLFPDLRRLDRA